MAVQKVEIEDAPFRWDIPQTDLSEWGSDGLLKDPVGEDPHRPPVRRSTFMRRLRTW